MKFRARERSLRSALFDIVDRMQSTDYGGLSVCLGLESHISGAGTVNFGGPGNRTPTCGWSNEITEMLRVPRRSFFGMNALDQAQEGHLVDALALRGDEGRSTLR